MMMTTVLLFIYLHNRNTPLWLSLLITLFFLSIEGGFLSANLLKFTHGGYVTILIAGALFVIMYIWYNGRRIMNHNTKYVSMKENIPIIENISNDTSIPKYCTHLVYVTRAKYKDEMETKIIHSLINKPKRADTYWFVYMKRSDEPYELDYELKTFVPQKIFRLDIKAGFKMGIHVDTYVHDICQEMEKRGEVDLRSRYPSLREAHIVGDFKFLVVERIIRHMDLPVVQKAILSFYQSIKKHTTSDTAILDLDPSVVDVEYIPLKNVHASPRKDQPYFPFNDED
jgi:KUP system potassium uptake protein